MAERQTKSRRIVDGWRGQVLRRSWGGSIADGDAGVGEGELATARSGDEVSANGKGELPPVYRQ